VEKLSSLRPNPADLSKASNAARQAKLHTKILPAKGTVPRAVLNKLLPVKFYRHNPNTQMRNFFRTRRLFGKSLLPLANVRCAAPAKVATEIRANLSM
jgi:hypothetical protein